jgi:hypothetical protein
MHEPYLNPDKLRELLDRAIADFNEKDAASLLAPNDRGVAIHERTIVHRLAYYLECRIRDDGAPENVSVDCEYNRFGTGTKYLRQMEGYAGVIEEADRKLTNRGELSILPDLIVHERGEAGPNYLVVEVKKDSNASGPAVELDRMKLDCLTARYRDFEYALGIELRARDSEGSSRHLEVMGTWRPH